MAVKVAISLKAPDDALTGYGSGALLRIQSSATETGTFADLAATPTEAVVAATYRYEHWDAAGDATTWYRWRLEDVGATETGDWSEAFQGLEAAKAAQNSGSYASIDDFLLEAGAIPADSRRLAAIERALVEARERLDLETGFDAFRHPQAGTEARLFHGNGQRLLHVHEGIVSLTSLEVRTETAGAWTTIDTADWWLEAARPGQLTARPGEPYFHIRLSDAADYTTFPLGEHRVRATGAFGWARPSQRHIGANIDLARQQIAADMSFPGGTVGQSELGTPMGPTRLPDTVWRLKLAESRRFQCSI
jgi:hypothetical protein